MQFAQSHLEISREIGDGSGELTARMNISDLQLVLGLNGGAGGQLPPDLYGQYQDGQYQDDPHGTRPRAGRRPSMENMELVKLSPESTEPRAEGSAGSTPSKPTMAKTSSRLFFIRRMKG